MGRLRGLAQGRASPGKDSGILQNPLGEALLEFGPRREGTGQRWWRTALRFSWEARTSPSAWEEAEWTVVRVGSLDPTALTSSPDSATHHR